MRAMIQTELGGPECLRMTEAPRPQPGPGEVLVRIAAASINAIDTKLRRFGGPLAPELPGTLGCDLAGVVEAVGAGVTHLKAGDRVMGCTGGVRGMPGAYAEYAAVDSRLLVPVPDNLTLREAAALPLVGITIWLNLVERARLSPGMHVLVMGGAGGVGTLAVQVAKALGAKAVATCAAGDADLVASLGAAASVDYRSATAAAELRALSGGSGYDIVFDAAGLPSLASAFAAARFGGQVVSLIDPGEQNLSPMRARQLSLHVSAMLLWIAQDIDRAGAGRMLGKIAKLASAGTVRPILDPMKFALEDVGAAHARLEQGEAVGKLIVDIDADLARKAHT